VSNWPRCYIVQISAEEASDMEMAILLLTCTVSSRPITTVGHLTNQSTVSGRVWRESFRELFKAL